MDAGKIVAEGSPRHLIDTYSTREVVELRFGDEAPATYVEKLAGIGDRLDPLPDRLPFYSTDGDGAVNEIHRRGFTRPACSCDGPLWRICSSSSPAAR